MPSHRKGMIGASAAFLEMMESVSRYARHQRPILVIGERGTGKEEIASRLHYLSPRWQQNLIKLNCAAFSDDLLDSELFGHEAGAFTGARQRRTGLFEAADGGTLFLDELATMGSRLQDKLLRVIEYGEFYRLGSSQSVKVDVRVVAATNENLPELAEKGEFRKDLLDRLAFDVIAVPPLRVRRDDIIELAHYFAFRMVQELGDELEESRFAGFTEQSLETLMDYDWPGNIRELKNAVERSVCHTEPGEPVTRIILDPFQSPWLTSLSSRAVKAENRELPTSEVAIQRIKSGLVEAHLNQLEQGEVVSLKSLQTDVEQLLLSRALSSSQFHQRKAAEKLGLSYDQLRTLVRKYPEVLSD
ncbi:phage shock protein operon transcriptional activator [Endozoicomonas numazuensis]|uniref:ATPase AAA n=1 Tax=Endozoicomonas numazuensis TaxID=1137799 RepID=A0A081NCP5_9GAMM|nr:phage shock protein operon transcriptional activator [Endozoicomonas numazuensis]KEQ16218.1 ATPase AAA [Endozoicomonas numazuensis]